MAPLQTSISAAELAVRARAAAERVSLAVAGGDGSSRVLRLGEQMDTQPLTVGPTPTTAGDSSAEQGGVARRVAGYLAKYVTKSVAEFGLSPARMSAEAKPKLGNQLGDVLGQIPATRRATPPCSALESPQAVVGVGPTVSGWVVPICFTQPQHPRLPSPPATPLWTRSPAARARTANSAALIAGLQRGHRLIAIRCGVGADHRVVMRDPAPPADSTTFTNDTATPSGCSPRRRNPPRNPAPQQFVKRRHNSGTHQVNNTCPV